MIGRRSLWPDRPVPVATAIWQPTGLPPRWASLLSVIRSRGTRRRPRRPRYQRSTQLDRTKTRGACAVRAHAVHRELSERAAEGAGMRQIVQVDTAGRVDRPCERHVRIEAVILIGV